MFKFLTMPEGQYVTAFITGLVILAAFALKAHPFKTKKRLVVSDLKAVPSMLTAGDYYKKLLGRIEDATTYEELQKVDIWVENYLDREFRVPVERSIRRRYWLKLVEAYAKKEALFEKIPVTICKS